jgi:hypothetical protein
LVVAALFVATVSSVLPSTLAVDTPSTAGPIYWRELRSPSYLWPGDGAIYYTLDTANGSKAHLVVIDLKRGKWNLKPAVNDPTAATSETANKFQASAAVNGGYFNLSDGASASYVVIDGKEVANPRINKALTENPKLATYLEHIFNRSEIRILVDESGSQAVRIMQHNDPVPQGLRLLHSLQAGPQLLPTVRDREEAFVRIELDGKEADSIGARRQAARTAFGITDDGYAMMLCVAPNNQDGESHGVTLVQLAELLKNLGCAQAINLDGGASTTMFVRLRTAAADSPLAVTPPAVVCGRTPETKVKSVLLLQKAP